MKRLERYHSSQVLNIFNQSKWLHGFNLSVPYTSNFIYDKCKCQSQFPANQRMLLVNICTVTNEQNIHIQSADLEVVLLSWKGDVTNIFGWCDY